MGTLNGHIDDNHADSVNYRNHFCDCSVFAKHDLRNDNFGG